MGIPVLWRTTKARYSLQGEVCPECERAVFPPRRLCPYCGCAHDAKHNVEQAKASEKSYSFTFMLPNDMQFSAAGDD
jgi:uncharacterized OB-fold protein